jgi:hypothetical protein
VKIKIDMDKKYACYCGLYCENYAVKVKIEPAADSSGRLK